jgi:tRNA (guanine37-N1)-methyltransferase
LIPEVLGNNKSLNSESFNNHLLEYPQYTKPLNWKELKVPDVLLSGNHKKIFDWRLKKSIEKTKKVRPDLLKLYFEKK